MRRTRMSVMACIIGLTSFTQPVAAAAQPGGADELDGDAGADSLDGNSGDDLLRAGGDTGTASCGIEEWCDRLAGGPGVDRLDGGSGLAPDLAAFYPDRSMRVHLGRGSARGEGRDTLLSIEAVAITSFSSPADDRVVGTAADEMFFTGHGRDVIIGRGGDDFVIETGDFEYETVSDVIRTGRGADYIRASDGDDRIDAGPGNDRVDVRGDSYGTGQEVRLGRGDDILESVETRTVSVWGGAGNDAMVNVGYRALLYGGRAATN